MVNICMLDMKKVHGECWLRGEVSLTIICGGVEDGKVLM